MYFQQGFFFGLFCFVKIGLCEKNVKITFSFLFYFLILFYKKRGG